ncbi:hypothetical protein AURDEDRAFT_160304 [Auricularia subglabra TFB-10046 SS5]|nr:hypothetical protein AURDEDRAFT_160304 [Auricularia subglabra TFB-10046 SS5]
MRFIIALAALLTVSSANPLPQSCRRNQLGELCCQNCGDGFLPPPSAATAVASHTPGSI